MFYDDSVIIRHRKQPKGCFCTFDEERGCIWQKENNNHRRSKNEIPRGTQNSILTIEVDASIESTGKKRQNGISC